ncbi:M23 family metallopeptidase [Streptomyces sp. NPDC048387]|uniref:M23 family metallopeptidase n=1 Tax=Streptomyces sp. NPDC048387 TaxID=3365542 RepID=UPI0037130577
MNDRPTSGQYPETEYDGLSTTTFAGDQPYVSYETQGQGYQYVTDYAASGSYGTYDAYGAHPSSPADTGAYDTTAWTGQQQPYLSTVPAQATPEQQTGQWDFSGYGDGYGNGYEQQYEYEQGQDNGGYEATTVVPVFTEADDETSVFEPLDLSFTTEDDEPQFIDAVHDLPTQAMPLTSAPSEPRASRRAGSAKSGSAKSGSPKSGSAKTSSAKSGSSRRRTPAKRSALLTVAVPSACVMGVAGIAAASVGGLTGGDKPSEDTTTMAAPDPSSVKPVAANDKLDTQLAALSADAGDFADRASRTQERIDLKQRQEEEKKKRAEEAAAKEAARPKFAIPVAQHGLSAMFGQAGGMWMSVHTGIDFPVSYGTPVMAATDGTMRTQWNSAYGNMAILTSPDGTETWYCHLSSTKIRSGQVKAGDVIAYSGNSGNSTGPHLHFEVRPGGGSAIDPLAWLRNHGLDPT